VLNTEHSKHLLIAKPNICLTHLIKQLAGKEL
jgi:hypothetical protein